MTALLLSNKFRIPSISTLETSITIFRLQKSIHPHEKKWMKSSQYVEQI